MAVGFSYIVLLSLLGLIWLWVAAVKRPRVRQPSCGRCRYPVQGLDGLTCPECGGDFREVGIITPTLRLMHPAVFIAIWTLLLPIPAALLTGLADRFAPTTVTGVCNFSVQPHSGSFPAVKIRQAMRCDVWGSGRGMSGVSVRTQSTPNGDVTTLGHSVMRDGWDTATFELREAGGGTVPPFVVTFERGEALDVDARALELWALTTAGTSDRQSVQEDVRELADLIESRAREAGSFQMQRLGLSSGVSTNTVYEQPWWFLAAISAFWVFVYAGGIVIFTIVRRRRIREPSQGTSASTS